MAGAYRRVLTKPIDMSWRFVKYNSPTEALIQSDLDELKGVDVKNTPDGQYKALLLTLSLPASCYATMALRELLKVDTSGDNQALQNNYHKVKGDKKETDENDPKTEDKDEKEEREKEENGLKRKLESEDSDAKRVKQDSE